MAAGYVGLTTVYTPEVAERHTALLAEGCYLAPHGYLALSPAATDEQLAGFLAAVGRVLSARSSSWS